MPYVRTVKELEAIMALTEEIETNEVQKAYLDQKIIRVTGKYSQHHLEEIYRGLQLCRFIMPTGTSTWAILRRSMAEEVRVMPKRLPDRETSQF